MWILRMLFCLKALPQVLQEYGFSPVWIFKCLFKLVFWLNLFPQVLQEYGFSPVWILKWSNKSVLILKLFPHISQVYGLSPVWILKWTFNVGMSLKPLPQVLQGYGLSPVWVLRCITNQDLNLNDFPQVSHVKDFLHLWVLRFLFVGKELSTLSRWLVLLWCISFLFDSSSLVDPGSTSSLPLWSWFSATGELWERSWSLFGSCPLWSISSLVGVNIKGSLSCFSTSCSPSWLVQSSSCSSLICGGSGSSWSRVELLSWPQSCCPVRTSSFSLQTCCGSSGGKKRHNNAMVEKEAIKTHLNHKDPLWFLFLSLFSSRPFYLYTSVLCCFSSDFQTISSIAHIYI